MARSLSRRVLHRFRGAAVPSALPPGTLQMGRHSYAAPTVHYYPGDTAKVRIGSFCSIGAEVSVMPGGNHRVDWVTTFPISLNVAGSTTIPDGIPTSKGDVVIGNDVWIGRGARILSGVTIGDGAVVGAFSVVTKPVRPYAIVAGAPAVERAMRFDERTVEALLRIRWWEWDDARIVEQADLFESTEVERFVSQYDPAHTP